MLQSYEWHLPFLTAICHCQSLYHFGEVASFLYAFCLFWSSPRGLPLSAVVLACSELTMKSGVQMSDMVTLASKGVA